MKIKPTYLEKSNCHHTLSLDWLCTWPYVFKLLSSGDRDVVSICRTPLVDLLGLTYLWS